MKNITTNKADQLLPIVTRRVPQQRILSAVLAAALFSVCALPAFAEDGTPVCGSEAHTHTEACYTSQLVCGLEETAPVEGAEAETAGHIHTEACYAPVLCCTAPEHTHTEACYPAPAPTEAPATEPDVTEAAPEATGTAPETVEITEEETPLDIRTVQLYRDEQVCITVTYDDETLPADAELVARPITAETAPAEYEALMAEASQALGTEDALPMVFYSIDFFVGGQRVEPTAPVDVKVQFLQDGFQVDEDMPVLHLDENGAEMLDSEVTVAENTAAFQA